eukprot:m.297513 g.297513  ORF g.297513 m.297513 type:complete len:61 (+) comp20082_c0_seq2:167-349(+)
MMETGNLLKHQNLDVCIVTNQCPHFVCSIQISLFDFCLAEIVEKRWTRTSNTIWYSSSCS